MTVSIRMSPPLSHFHLSIKAPAKGILKISFPHLTTNTLKMELCPQVSEEFCTVSVIWYVLIKHAHTNK